MKKVLILCGGGHAKCVIDAMRLGGKFSPCCVLDLKERVGKKVLGVKITGADTELAVCYKRGIKLCFLALGSTGDPARRIALWNLALKAGFELPSIIHPSAVVSAHASIGRGVYVGPGAIVNAGAVIGEGCIINSGAIVEHDCRIGAFVHIAPGAVLSGGVIVGDRSHLGTGCSVMHGIRIGEDSIIGVGSSVVKDIPARTVCVGNPAKRIKSR
ncbi:MAG: acetyltransferase [Elusimicrobiota bacterium]|nr:acetyltransferase [Elusimicrobiota bacterium]